MGREFEKKLGVREPELLGRILGSPRVLEAALGQPRRIMMKSLYYDTPEGALSARRWTLRLRQENEKTVATVKTPGDGTARGEWEAEAEDMKAAIPALLAAGAPRELGELTAAGVILYCGAVFTRTALDLRLKDGTLAELAADRGVLTGGGKKLPFAEVEVELKQGSEEAVLAFARGLEEVFDLVPEEKSKFARALALAQEEENGRI